MEFRRIIYFCVAAAIAYGILHDQVTARICVEYFTIGHPPIFGTNDPTILAVGWGILTTWWVGLILGLALAVVARAGQQPKRTARSLIRAIAILMCGSALCAVAGGLLGWALAANGVIALEGYVASDVPQSKHVSFVAVGGAHLASYVAAFAGGIYIIARIGWSRFFSRSLQ
jgi:hypothetical protein